MLNILIILLGCNIYDILQNRIEVAGNFVRANLTDSNIDWFLSGGIKYGSEFNSKSKSEAAIMQQLILTQLTDIYSDRWNFILDTKSTNTAQNFIRASIYYNQTSSIYDDVYIVTSDFHKERAAKLMNYVDPTNQFKWILGSLELKDSRHMELVHMKNVYSDYIGGLGMVGESLVKINEL